MTKKIDIIIPVYDGLADTIRCIESVLASIDFNLCRLILVDDHSPNTKISQFLVSTAKQYEAIKLIINSDNTGFVLSVNKAMSLSDSADVILVNSDVEVANDWAERLHAAAYSEDKIGTVTASSNNATICSFPNFCEENQLAFGLPLAEIDNVFRASGNATIEIPTAVGSCMYIRRACLDDIGLFDYEAFGLGYGEENDFSRSALRAGWKNIHATNVYVYHAGGVSFGEQKQERIDKAVAKVEEKNPGYLKNIHDFVANDPGKLHRLNILFNLISTTKIPKILDISHGIGGGVGRHINDLASEQNKNAIHLEIAPSSEKFIELSIYCNSKKLNDKIFFNINSEKKQLLELLINVGISHIHIHHLIGWENIYINFSEILNCTYDITLHDYYYINGSPTQTDLNGLYTEIEEKVLLKNNSPIRWRKNSLQLLEGARYLISPSRRTIEIYQKIFPTINITYSPHTDIPSEKSLPVFKPKIVTKRLRIGVVGAISKEKGADIIESVAKTLKADDAQIDIILIGYAYRKLSSLAYSTGPYMDEDLQELINKNLIDVLWYPALWPETYCYTLSAALIGGMPVIANNIGAFTERLKNRPLSYIVKNLELRDPSRVFNNIKKELSNTKAINEWTYTKYNNFYESNYLINIKINPSNINFITNLTDIINHKLTNEDIEIKITILRLLVKLKNLPIIALLVRLIPISIQRKIKRTLSRKPLHDLL